MLQPGTELGNRYRLVARLGAGGMGEVWRAEDQLLGRTVAVKAMLPAVAGDPGFARRFQVEAKAMAQVNHPAVASIHDFGRGGGVTFLVMEFVEGESLDRLLARTGRLDPAATMRLIAQAARGLQAVHQRGIVHRDIKPANLMVRRDGSVVLTDFGISRSHDAGQLTASGAILGTPTYLSPEQVLGQPATALSDVYSLGLTAYECLAGHRPFEGDNPYAVALQRLQSAPRTMGIVLPPAVLATVEGALATDPGRRWQSAGAFADAADAAAGNAPPLHPAGPGAAFVSQDPAAGYAAPAYTSGTVAPKAAGRRWAVIVAAALAVLVLGGAGTWALTRHGHHAAGAALAAPAASKGPVTAKGPAAPAGFVVCGPDVCPAQPMCWAGETEIGGRAMPINQLDCGAEHTWETFAAVPLPAGSTQVSPEGLIGRADVAKACSAAVMAGRSRKPARTRSWIRDAWPIQLPGGPLLIHCLARPGTGDPAGPAF